LKKEVVLADATSRHRPNVSEKGDRTLQDGGEGMLSFGETNAGGFH